MLNASPSPVKNRCEMGSQDDKKVRATAGGACWSVKFSCMDKGGFLLDNSASEVEAGKGSVGSGKIRILCLRNPTYMYN